jgi:hypothetical protein
MAPAAAPQMAQPTPKLAPVPQCLTQCEIALLAMALVHEHTDTIVWKSAAAAASWTGALLVQLLTAGEGQMQPCCQQLCEPPTVRIRIPNLLIVDHQSMVDNNL